MNSVNRANQDVDPYCIEADEADAVLRDAPWQRFVVIGDSIAEGVGSPVDGYVDQGWADTVADALKRVQPGLTYLNLGVRNLVAAEVREQQLDKALSFKPDLAAVIAGGNDILRRSFDVDKTEAEIEFMISAFRDTGADVFTMGLFDSSASKYVPEEFKAALSSRTQTLSSLTKALTARHGSMYVDLTSSSAGNDPGIYASDGRHVNARGHAIAAAITIRCLGKYLGT
jgi:lysophospholipase L1-like esterase